MKSIWTIAVMLGICSILFPCITNAQVKLPKNTNQYLTPVEEINNILLDVTEVTLGDWFAFMQVMHDQGYGKEILSLAPDMEAVPEKLISTVKAMLIQFEKGEFGSETAISSNSRQVYSVPDENREFMTMLEFPVTGISYDQVQQYLIWREDKMLEDRKVQRSGLGVSARLLSPSEWDALAAKSGPRDVDNNTIYPDTMNTHGCYLMNIRYQDPCESTLLAIEKYKEGLYPGAVFWPDKNGVYDLFGNVAEMTSEKGIATGGSYHHWGAEGRTGEILSYSKPEKWLGFRVAFEFFND